MTTFSLRPTPPNSPERSRQIGRVVNALEELARDRAWRVEVSEDRHKRSDAQNAYYWAVVVEAISRESGYEPEEVHEYLCGQRWGWKDRRVPSTPRNPAGVESVPVRTTTRDSCGRRAVLGTTEFAEFIEFARRFAAEKLNVVTPDPEQERAA